MVINTSARKAVPSSGLRTAETTNHVAQFASPQQGGLYVCILELDRRLRKILNIAEFSDRRDCVLRFAHVRSQKHVRLGDGSEIRKGDQIIELHFWNEHLSLRRDLGRSLGSAAALRRRLRISLELLGERLTTDFRVDDIRALHARIVLNLQGREDKLIAIARHYGFVYASSIPCLTQRCHDLFENLLIYSLIWAFNRPLLRKSVGRLSRADLWMSRNQFLTLYGPPLRKGALASENRPYLRREGGAPTEGFVATSESSAR